MARDRENKKGETMKILIYGDSNVWGYRKIPREFRENPEIKIRQLDEKTRWAGIFSDKIRKKYGTGNVKIMIDGLNSRVAGDEENDEKTLNSKADFAKKITKNLDFNLIIIALGTNDLKPKYDLSPDEISRNILWYKTKIHEIREEKTIKILFILPPNFVPKPGGMRNSVRKTANNFAKKSLAKNEFLEIEDIDLSEDGVHFSDVVHAEMAVKVFAKTEEIL